MMLNTAYETIQDVDIVLFLIDATKNFIGKAEREILERIKKRKGKTILVINKIDLIKKEKLLELIETYRNECSFEEIIPISALKKDGVELILNKIIALLPNGPAYYDIEEYTNQTMRQMAEEIIREKALMFLDEEVPHGIYVEIEKYKDRKTAKQEDIIDIDATLYCLRDSHKGIIIGKNGRMLKKIGQATRIELEKLLDTKVNLQLWVKVKQDWQDQENIVKKFDTTK